MTRDDVKEIYSKILSHGVYVGDISGIERAQSLPKRSVLRLTRRIAKGLGFNSHIDINSSGDCVVLDNKSGKAL